MTDRGEIRSLTGLRGIAACFVMVYHFFQTPSLPPLINNVLMHGYLAVDMFFVLSGFVIAMIYGQRFADNPTVALYRDFLVRRIGRVYPLYAVITLLIIAIKTGSSDPAAVPGAAMIASNMLLVQTWGFAESINGTTWSISTELGAYLLFPVTAMLILRGGAGRAAIATTVAAVVLLALSLVGTPTLHQIYGTDPLRNGPLDIFGTGTVFPMIRCLAGFSLGVAACRLQTAVGPGFGRAADPLALIVVGLLAIRGSDVAFVLTCVPLVIALATSDRSFVARLLGTPVIYWLGMVSYSIYLVHRLVDEYAFYPLFHQIEHIGVPHPYSLARIGIVGIVLLVSAATYYAIESPARDAVRHLIRRRRILAA